MSEGRPGRSPGRRPLSTVLLAWYAVVVVGFVAVFATVVTASMREVLLDGLVRDLEGRAAMVEAALGGLPDPGPGIDAMAAAGDVRITLIATDGRVLADSAEDPAAMEDHSGRPEVVGALAGAVGVDRRRSATTGATTLYVAIPPTPGSERLVRVAVTEQQVAAHLASVRARVVGIAVAAAVAGVLAVAVVARRLARPLEEVASSASEVAAGGAGGPPPRSGIAELDRLGSAVAGMASELGRRISETERERATLQVVLGALPTGAVLVEADDAVAYANPAAERLLGGVGSVLRGIAPPALQHLVRQVRESGRPASRRLEHGLPPRALRATATPFRDDARVLMTVVDLTEQERVERMRRDFVADASHELKTPVSAILASAEALRLALERDPGRAEEFLTRVEGSAGQLARLVDDLLDLSRLEASHPGDARVRLDRVAAEEAGRLGPRAEEAGLGLEVTTEPVWVAGSERDLGLAIRNLIDNAVRYTDPGGRVGLSVRREGGRAVVEVVDTGEGIPTRSLPRVFERFYRVDAARARATGGTGLGLAIVKHVAESHGGRVTVESELGAGSVFRIELPAGQVEPPGLEPDAR